MNQPIKKAIVLSSGGLDSTTAMAIAANQSYQIYSISFDYGQRHLFELDRAKEIAKHYKVKEHLILKVDLKSIGGSALTSETAVPKDSLNEEENNIPVTYVPARNLIFLSLAVAWGEVIGAYDIFIGVNAIDYSGYPDCREEFLEAFEKMVRVGTKAGVEGKK
ncbi:MAG: 7-cyano-7-deazaguanine synthase QueC, partial [Nitrospinae bacterium]|nr:7-cyano-7-deazaguanine synthase QueC [Nitrospinota bacterium]